MNPISNYRHVFFVAENSIESVTTTTTTVTAAIGQEDLLADEIVSEHLTRYPFPPLCCLHLSEMICVGGTLTKHVLPNFLEIS